MKGKPPSDIQKRRKQGRPPKKKRHKAPAPWGSKEWVSFWITVIGLPLGVIALILALRSFPDVSLQPPLDSADILTGRFTFSDAGIIDLRELRISMFEINVQYASGFNPTNNVGRDWKPPDDTLKSGEPETVPFLQFLAGDGLGPVRRADIALIASWKFPWLWFKRECVFHFVSVQQRDGTLRLEPQAGEERILKQFHEVEKQVRHRTAFAPF